MKGGLAGIGMPRSLATLPEAIVTVDSIAAGGDGVARHENLVVFIPRSAPGDRGLVTYAQRGGFARGELRRLDAPSHYRVAARCIHYERDRCGGCQLQHLGYDQQLLAKERIVRDAMERIARRPGGAVTMHPAPLEWGYRRKLTLEIRREGETLVTGLHPYDKPAAVFQLEECEITGDDVLRAWREILANTTLLPRARRLRASVLVLADGAHLSVGGGTNWTSVEDLARACPSLVSIWWTCKGGEPLLVFSRGVESRAGASFAQVNDAVAVELREFVLGAAQTFAPKTVVDAYSGVGTTAVALALAGARVTAIESDVEAVGAFTGLLPPGSRAIQGFVEGEIHHALPADLVLLNPPRSGIHESVAAELSRPGAVGMGIIYTSCNAATLARDLARLPGFAIASTDCFDMFPQTAHIETVCVLKPDAERAPT